MRDRPSLSHQVATRAKARALRVMLLQMWSSIRAALSSARSWWWDRRSVRVALGALLVAAAYYLGTLIGLSVTFESSPISPIWPPNAILLVALLLVPMRTWWAYLLAVFGAHLLIQLSSGVPPLTAVGFYFTNTAEAVVGAYLVRRFIGGPPWLGSLRRAAIYVACAVIAAPLLTSFADAAVVVLTHYGENYWLNWQTRTVSNSLAELTIGTALLLALTEARNWGRGASRWRWIEAALLATCVLFISVTIFGGEISWRGSAPVLVYAVLPLLLWAAIRFGTSGTSFALLGITVLATWSASQGHGPFSADTPAVNVISLQLYLIGISVPMLLLAGLMQEHREAAATLQESEVRFRALADQAPVLIWMSGTDSLCTYFNAVWLAFTGRTVEQERGIGWVEGVHPDDTQRCLEIYMSAFATRQSFEMEYRLRRHDGAYRWVVDSGVPRYTPTGRFEGYVGSLIDISERRQTAEALEQSEARYRDLVESQTEMICRYLPDSTLTFVNEAYCRYHGKSREQLIDSKFLDLMDGAERDNHVRHTEALLHGTHPLIDEHATALADGRIAWQQWVDHAIRDDQGTVVEIQSIGRDITNRKRAEEQLQESEARFRAAFESAATGMMLVDTTGRAFQVNRPLAEMLGYSQEELLAVSFVDITHPDDLEGNLAQFRACVAGEIDSYRLEKRFFHKQGHLVWTSLSAGIVRDAAGQPLYLIGQVQDITERKRAEEALRASEERYRAVVNNFPQGVVLLFEHGLRHVVADGQGLSDLGLSKEAVEGKTLEEAFPADLSDALAPHFQDALAGKSDALDLTHGGRTYQTHVLPIHYGETAAGMAVMHDVTDQRRAEVLAELDRTKTAFFSNVSHEFRTPLTLLLAPAEDALADRVTPLPLRHRQRLELIRTGGLRLHRLVDTLLEFSRIEAGHFQASFAPTDVATLTADLASAFRSAVERVGLRLLVECAPLDDLARPAYVDSDMWEQMVLNLLSNALKFTFAGEIAVTVRAARDQSDWVELEVRDTGTGIPAPELPHVFERFYRVQGTQGRTSEGTGIGLALVQELARLHGGTVRVESVLGKGSTFTVAIPTGSAHLPADRVTRRTRAGGPRAQALRTTDAMLFAEELTPLPSSDAADMDTAWNANSPGASAPRHEFTAYAARGIEAPARATILVADDNADMCAYLTRLLSERWDVQTVADGPAALTAASVQPPDLIVADVMMPGLDGFELIAALRDNPQTHALPVILLSGRAGDEPIVEALQAGADDYLVKPFSSRELLARVQTHLDLTRARREAAARAAELDAIFHAIGDGVLVHDLEGRRLHANQAYRDLLRRHLELQGQQVAPETLLEIPDEWEHYIAIHDEQGRVVPPEEWATARALRGEILTGADAIDEYTQGADGEILQVNVSAAPVRDASGHITGAVAVFRDVTQRRQLERKVLEQASHLAAVFEAKADGIAVFDLQGRYLIANQALRALFGMDADTDYTSRSLSERMQRVQLFDEEGQRIPEVQWPHWRVLRGENLAGASAMDARIRTLDGREVWISTSGAPIRSPDGKVTGVVLVTRDVTARRALERRVAEQASQLQAIFETMSDGVAMFEQFGRPVIANQAWQDMLLHIADLRGLSTEPAFTELPFADKVELVSLQSPIGADGRAISVEDMPTNRALKGETITGQDAVDERVEGPEGQVFESSVSAAPMRDADGNITGVVVVSRDVTARRALERQVAEQANQLQAVFDAMTDGVFVLDEDGRVTSLNSAGRQLVGLRDDVDIVQTAEGRAQALDLRGPEGQPLPADQLPTVRLLRGEELAGANAQTFTMTIRAHANEVRTVSLTGAPLRGADGGQIYGAVAVFRDITELKRTQAALADQVRLFKTLVENSPDIITRFDRDLRHLYVNPASEAVTGISADTRMGKTYAEIGLPEAVFAPWEATLREVFEAGELQTFETGYHTAGQAPRVSRVTYIPEFAADESVESVLGITTDITELKRAEEALRAATAAAEAAQQEEERRRREAERREQVAESLRGVLTILNSDRQVTKILDFITRQAGRLLSSDATAIYMTDSGSALGSGPEAWAAQAVDTAASHLVLKSAFGLPTALTTSRGKHRLSVGDAAVRRAMVARRPVAVQALAAAPHGATGGDRTVEEPDPLTPIVLEEEEGGASSEYLEVREEALPKPYRALLAIPIVAQGQVYGSLLLLYTAPRRFSADEVALALAYGDQIALAVANAQLQDHIERAATENERNRLARDLHDTVTQEIFTASVLAESIPKVWDLHREQAEENLRQVHQLTHSALAALRALLLELRPAVLEEKALPDLLRQLGEVMTMRSGAPITVDVEGIDPPIPVAVKVAFYRIAQEALTNAAKYAQARHITVRLRYRRAEEAVELEVRDDGLGFDMGAVPAGHFGIGMMRERARAAGASLRITSRPEHGTRLAIKWSAKGRDASGDQEYAAASSGRRGGRG